VEEVERMRIKGNEGERSVTLRNARSMYDFAQPHGPHMTGGDQREGGAGGTWEGLLTRGCRTERCCTSPPRLPHREEGWVGL
jgi:hypothetical protein